MPSSRIRFVFLLIAAMLTAGQFLLFQTLISTGALPNPIAVHWGFSGAPDGFGDPNAYVLGITFTYLVLLSLLAYFGFGLRKRLLKPLLFGTMAFLFGFLFLLFSITTLIQVGRSATDAALEPWLLISLLVLPLGIVALALGTPQVSLSDKLQISVRGLALLKLDYSALVSVEQITLRARDFGGLGIRYGNKTLAFIPSPGSGVLISTNFGESIAVRTKNPEILIAALKAKIGS